MSGVSHRSPLSPSPASCRVFGSDSAPPRRRHFGVVIAQRDPNFEVCRGERYELPSLPAACIHLPVLRSPKLVFRAGASCASVSPSVQQAGATACSTCVSVPVRGPCLPECCANTSAHACQPQQEMWALSAPARRGDGGDSRLSVSPTCLLHPLLWVPGVPQGATVGPRPSPPRGGGRKAEQGQTHRAELGKGLRGVSACRCGRGRQPRCVWGSG